MKITNKMRFMLIMLSVLMVLSLFACAETPEETTTKAPVETTEKPTETTEKTEPTEAPVDTDATDAPVVNETTDADVAETTENETESESASETASESATTETTEAATTETETTEAPACDHAETEVDAAVAPTCEETGLTEGSHCAICGAVVVAQDVVPAKGHAWDEGVVTTEPTCEEAGVKTYTCANDATHTYTAEIPAGDHAWDNGVVTTEATCEAKGVKTYTCSKDATHIYTEEIPEKGHAYDGGVVTTEPTCVDKGVKIFTCANDPSHSYTEEIPENGHTEATDKAVAPTCEEKGLTEGKHCSVCSVVLVPQEEIGATGHTRVDHAWTAPTTAEEGWEAYKSCENCDKLWNAEDEEIDAITTIAKIVPTTDMYFGFEELKNKQVGGVQGSKFGVSPAADRTYVSFKRTGDSEDGSIMLLEGNTAVTGNYLVIKYKTDHMASIQIWANTVSNGHDNGHANFYQAVVKDSQWHILVVNLADKLGTYIKADENGDYTIQWARIDLLDGAGSSGYFDIAFAAYCDDLADIEGILQDGDEAYCSHIIADTPVFTNRGENHSTECIICGSDVFYQHSISGVADWNYTTKKYSGTCACGETLEREMLVVSEGYINGTVGLGRMSAERFEAEGVTRYTVTSTGDIFFHVYAEGTAVTGQYAVIKYRVSNGGANANFGNTFAGSAMDTDHGLAGSSSDQFGTTNSGVAYADGEWHYHIVKATSAHFLPNEDGTYTYKFLRFGLTDVVAGSYIEIDEVAFADNKYAADRYAYGDEAVCAHANVSKEFIAETGTLVTTCLHCGNVTEDVCSHSVLSAATWDSDAKIYKATCADCGNTVTKDVVYRSEANSNGTVGSNSNFLNATTVTEGGETFVRYTPNGVTPANDDPYFLLWADHTSAVTGQFMIIKYRITNNGKNMSAAAPFAGSAPSGTSGATGKNGDSKNSWGSSTTLYADGEWHYLVLTPNLAENKTFTANNDGTYTWKWARIRFNGFDSLNGSCYIDIEEIAFTDNSEAASYYVYKNDTTGKSFRFVVNLDNTNVTLDNVSFMGAAAKKDSVAVELDMTGKTLTTPTSFDIGGWVCIDGGVKAYKVRVTSVDGVAVENPELVHFTVASNRGDIYTANKSYYLENCAVGAGMNKAPVDLTAWAGHTVNFEIVVISNFGDEIVVVKANNVTVPLNPNYVITASKLAGLTEHTGLNYALDESGEFVTYTQKTDGSSDCFAYITFPNASVNTPKDPTGQYVIIKYRTTYDDRIEIFAGANNGSTTAKGSVDNFSLTQKEGNTGSLIADGEWQYVILALHDIIGDFGKPTNAFAPEDGTEDTFILDYLRLDFFNSASNTARTVDVAFVAYADSVEKLVSYAGMDSYTYVYGYSGGVLYETVEVE